MHDIPGSNSNMCQVFTNHMASIGLVDVGGVVVGVGDVGEDEGGEEDGGGGGG
jgi:hypothetical protein